MVSVMSIQSTTVAVCSCYVLCIVMIMHPSYTPLIVKRTSYMNMCNMSAWLCILLIMIAVTAVLRDSMLNKTLRGLDPVTERRPSFNSAAWPEKARFPLRFCKYRAVMTAVDDRFVVVLSSMGMLRGCI